MLELSGGAGASGAGASGAGVSGGDRSGVSSFSGKWVLVLASVMQ